jgi:hypothetical protein
MAATRRWGIVQFPIHLGVRISPEDRARLRRLVAQHGGDQSSVVRELLRQAAPDEDGEAEAEVEEVTVIS